MPFAAPRPCARPGCRALVRKAPRCPEHARKKEQERGTAMQRGYDSKWRKARFAYLKRHPLCLMCAEEKRVTPATVVDHRIPHRGDSALFWAQSNWQPLCKPHHDRKTATEDGGFGR